MFYHKHRTTVHLCFLLISIAGAITFAVTGVFDHLITNLGQRGLWFALPLGFAFVSIFTVAPAGVMLYELGAHEPIFPLALLATIGSVTADLIIFHFVRRTLFTDFGNIMHHSVFAKISALARKQRYHWILVIIGAIIVASPFPDEVGLTIMGVSGMSKRIFLPLVLMLDFIGILLIVLFGAVAS